MECEREHKHLKCMEDGMKQLKKNILNIRNNYENLLLLSKDSFATIKTKDFEKHKAVKEREMREFALLNSNKEQLKTYLEEKAAKYGVPEMRIRDLLEIDGYSESQKTEMEKMLEEMLKTEQEFQTQIKMTIEIARVMYEMNGKQLEKAFEIAKREKIDKTGSMLLEEDF